MPVALHGSKLPGGITIKGKAPGRGVPGDVVLLGRAELKDSDYPGGNRRNSDSAGDYPPGMDIKEALDLGERSLILKSPQIVRLPQCAGMARRLQRQPEIMVHAGIVLSPGVGRIE